MLVAYTVAIDLVRQLRPIVDQIKMEFLYADGDDYFFMDTSNYEQTHLKRDTLGDAV